MATHMLQHTPKGHLGVTVKYNGWFAHVDQKPTPLSEIDPVYHDEIKRHVREIADGEGYDMMNWGV